METLIIVLSALIVFIALILIWLFKYAFVRSDNSRVDDLDDKINEPLKPYKDIVSLGMDFVLQHPHTQVYTQSFDGLKLAGRYYENEGSDRTIIIFHGYRSSGTRDFSCAVRGYYNMGLNVLLVDQRAHGKSEGRLITFGVKERRDVLSWINYVLENKGNAERIFLGGLSMGASTVLLATGLLLPENVKGIVADCGYTSPVEIIREVAKKSFKVRGIVIIPMLDAFCKLIGKFSIYGISTVDALKYNKIPILFIHGDADSFVPVEMSQRSYDAAQCDKKIVIVKGAEHGLSYLVDTDTVSRALNEFIAENSNK